VHLDPDPHIPDTIQHLNLKRIHADPDSHPHPRYPAWSELDFYSKCWLFCESVPKLADHSMHSKLSAAVNQVSMQSFRYLTEL
jgi:hypothetical protein